MKSLLIFNFALFLLSYDLSKDWSLQKKKKICLNNLSYCSIYCDGFTQINICDSNSLLFTFLCSDGNWPKNVTHYSFPIEIEQCLGEQEECVVECLINNGGERNTCADQCKQKKCGTAQSTQSKSFQIDPQGGTETTKSNNDQKSEPLSWFLLILLLLI